VKETFRSLKVGNSLLARKLLFSILLFSTLVTLVLTTIQIYLDYRMGVRSIERTIAEIGSTQLSTLTENMWTMNQDQVKTQLKGLLEIESITELTIEPAKSTETSTDEDLTEYFSIKKNAFSNALQYPDKIIEYYPLVYKRDNQSYPLGTLKVVGDKGPVVDALQSRILIILLSQGAKTFLVSFFIIFIFNSLINRHLIQVSHFAQKVSLENMNTMLSLPRKPQKKKDELDQLVQSLNLMQLKISDEIAQRKHFERQLRQSQKMEALGTLASGIAHDFNNILQGLYNALFLIEEEVIDNAEALKNLTLATNLTDRARELIKQILLFSRQEEGKFKAFSPTPAIQDVVEILRAARPKEISIDLLLDLPKTKILGDQTQLKQVVLNLGNNAIGALEQTDKPQITIKVSSEMVLERNNLNLAQGNFLKIEVKDNGHGIDERYRDRIFEPFFTTKEVGKGTGLGLSVVHGIVQSHGGSISVDSKVGEGTLFSVYLPFLQRSSLNNVIVYNGGEEIHIVSSDEALQSELKETLLEVGHGSIQAYTNLEETFAQIKNHKKKAHKKGMIFIIDEEVGSVSSIELIRKLRQFYQKTPLIYLTSSNTRPSSLPVVLGVCALERAHSLNSPAFKKAFQKACELLNQSPIQES